MKSTTSGPSLRRRPLSFHAYLRQGTIAPQVYQERWTNDPWIYYGRDNLFPERLRTIADNCAPVERSVTTLAQFIAGDGEVRFYDRNGDEIPAAQNMLLGWMQEASLEQFLYRTAYDLALGLGKAWNVRRSVTRIVALDHVDVSRLRSGRLVDGQVTEYYWSGDWSRYQKDRSDERYMPVRTEALDFSGRTRQDIGTVYSRIYKQGRDYYTEPPWLGAATAAEVWSKIDNYNRVQIDTGFAPTVILSFNIEGTETELDKLDEDIEQVFTSSMGKGYMTLHYGAGEEKPDVKVLERGNHAGEIDGIATRCADVIYDAFGIPSLLMRDRVDGLTSQGQAVLMRMQQFQRMSVAPLQQVITADLVRLLNLAGMSDVWEARITPLEVFDMGQNEEVLMASTTVDEARKQRGEEAAEDATWGSMPLARVGRKETNTQTP